MPKQVYTIKLFHGGLNSEADPRDIADDQLADSSDIIVSEVGRIRMLGGTTAHKANINAISGWTGTLIPGMGLFYFSHDRLEGEDAGASAAETGDNYLAMYDDNDQQVWIYSEVEDDGGATGWDDDDESAGNGVIDLGSTGSAEPTFYFVDGALRVSDGAFGTNNESKWYGYVDRYFFGDGSSGHDGHGSDAYANGLRINKWVQDEIAPKALTIRDWGFLEDHDAFEDTLTLPNAANPISIIIYNVPYNYVLNPANGDLTAETHSTNLYAEWRTASPHITILTGSKLSPGLDSMFAVGDKVFISDADDAGNNGIKTVTAVSGASPNTMDISGTVLAESTDNFYITNLSRGSWFDPDNQSWEIGVSTLYDDGKQESPISIHGSAFGPSDWLYLVGAADGPCNMHQVAFQAYCFAGDGTNDGISVASPRVSGFNIYMRRENETEWYQQANVDITLGIKLANEGTYTMWGNYGGDTSSDEITEAFTGYVYAPQTVVTYDDSAGVEGATTIAPFDGTGTGFKTAVVTNRRAYVGNFRAKDASGNAKVYGDAIMKSQINKFDSFSIDRRLEAEVSDGDEIVKLEEYADRILQFKKKKMTLINISQEVEFIEETFPHKGVAHSASVCKTDFGVAWANTEGVYLYDGQRVTNLLEKGGMRLISSSEWFAFHSNNQMMVGYAPKQRHLIVIDDVTTRKSGAIYLFDLVTQSWTKGAAATFPDQIKTNFIVDWDGELVFGHTSGTLLQWDDAADSGTIALNTKDIDFGVPAVRKKIYKVYVSYKGDGSAVTVGYRTNGETTATPGNFYKITSATDGSTSGATDSNTPLWSGTAGTTDWLKAELKPVASINNINSIQLVFGGTGAADFEINDISIVYRVKGVK